MTPADRPVTVGSGVPSRAARWLAPGLVTILMTLAVGWLARAPYQPPGAEDGLLRLSWRMRAPDTETCRVRSQAELDALPVHMRTPEVCESHSAAWELVVQVDSLAADTTRVLQGGARRDRPLFVLRELPLEPGAHHVRISFAPAEGLRENGTAVPLVFDSVLRIASGEVALVTLERERGTFIVRRSIQATKGITE
jgi:hypothetical protein